MVATRVRVLVAARVRVLVAARVRVLVAARVRVWWRLGLGLSGGYFRVRR